MSHDHKHSHSHISGCSSHAHLHGRKLFLAIIFNILLTLVQIVAGVFAGSLALIADAIHNLSDAGALLIAYIANKISTLPADDEMTFGYGRAQILGALINSVTLVLVGIYLLYEAFIRFMVQEPVDGLILIIVAGFALIVDLITAFLTYSGARDNINMRAAFIHNISDALASLVVILSGVLILFFKLYWVDLVATVLISIYILYHSFSLIKEIIKTLMQSVPSDIKKEEVIKKIEELDNVEEAHHLHIWSIDDKFRSLEGHIVVNDNFSLKQLEEVKQKIKVLLKDEFKISHSTIEFEGLNSEMCKNQKKGEHC